MSPFVRYIDVEKNFAEDFQLHYFLNVEVNFDKALALINSGKIDLHTKEYNYISSAFQHKNFPTAKALMDAKIINPDAALLQAASYAAVDIAEYALSLGANLEARDAEGKTPLLLAAYHERVQRASCFEATKYFAAKGADLNAVDNNNYGAGYTALAHVIFGGTFEDARYLVEKGASLAPHGGSMLMHAVKTNHVAMVDYFLKNGADASYALDNGFNLLHAAASNQASKEIVQLLIDGGAAVNGVCITNKSTPLTKAAHAGSTDLAQLLLEKGANLEHQDFYGLTPLIHAAGQGHTSTVAFLLDCGANIHARDSKNGFTPLNYAAYNLHYDCVMLLMEHKADMHVCDKKGRTPFINACKKNGLNIVQYFIEVCGYDPHTKDAKGLSALDIVKDKTIKSYLLQRAGSPK